MVPMWDAVLSPDSWTPLSPLHGVSILRGFLTLPSPEDLWIYHRGQVHQIDTAAGSFISIVFRKSSLFWVRIICFPVTPMLDETFGSLCRSGAIDGFWQRGPAEHQHSWRGQMWQMAVSTQQKQKSWWAASSGLSLRWGCSPPAKQRPPAPVGQRRRDGWSNPVQLTLVNGSHQQVNIGAYAAVGEYSDNILLIRCTRFWLKQAKHA